MSIWTVLGGCLLLATISTLVTVSRRGEPQPKRTHLFEDENGERANPFGELSAGAEASPEGCNRCDTPLDVETYNFCTGCGETAVADD